MAKFYRNERLQGPKASTGELISFWATLYPFAKLNSFVTFNNLILWGFRKLGLVMYVYLKKKQLCFEFYEKVVDKVSLQKVFGHCQFYEIHTKVKTKTLKRWLTSANYYENKCIVSESRVKTRLDKMLHKNIKKTAVKY